VLKEKFKNIATHYSPDLSIYMIYELIARILVKGEISRVLPSSLFSPRSYLVIASRVYAGLGRNFKQNGECDTVYD